MPRVGLTVRFASTQMCAPSNVHEVPIMVKTAIISGIWALKKASYFMPNASHIGYKPLAFSMRLLADAPNKEQPSQSRRRGLFAYTHPGPRLWFRFFAPLFVLPRRNS